MFGAEQGTRSFGDSVADDGGGRAGAEQRLGVFRVREKGDVALACLLEPADAADLDVAVTLEAARESFGKLP